jgi:cysteinyl-tRNA synthetase
MYFEKKDYYNGDMTDLDCVVDNYNELVDTYNDLLMEFEQIEYEKKELEDDNIIAEQLVNNYNELKKLCKIKGETIQDTYHKFSKELNTDFVILKILKMLSDIVEEIE